MVRLLISLLLVSELNCFVFVSGFFLFHLRVVAPRRDDFSIVRYVSPSFSFLHSFQLSQLNGIKGRPFLGNMIIIHFPLLNFPMAGPFSLSMSSVLQPYLSKCGEAVVRKLHKTLCATSYEDPVDQETFLVASAKSLVSIFNSYFYLLPKPFPRFVCALKSSCLRSFPTSANAFSRFARCFTRLTLRSVLHRTTPMFRFRTSRAKS